MSTSIKCGVTLSFGTFWLDRGLAGLTIVMSDGTCGVVFLITFILC